MLNRRGFCYGAGALATAGALCGPAVAEDAPWIEVTPKAEETQPDLVQAGPLPEKTMGRPGAPVTVVEYASLGCPICRVFHSKAFPRLKADYIDKGKVFYIYREFPIGASAAAAASVARCVPEKDFFRANERLMANQGQWAARDVRPDALYKLVQDTGLSRAAFDTCLANQNISNGIVWVKQQGRRLGVQGTPTFFINGQKVRGVQSYEEMQKLIEPHLKSAAKPA